MKQVSVLITDLDDTIWDWLSMWYKSFNPYFESIKTECGIDEKTLKKDFKKLHCKYHTSEVSYAYKELKSIDEKFYPNFEGENKILHHYNSNKKHNLELYDKVRETLTEIRSKGTKIIGFTESNIFYTKYRIKTLGLDGLFDIIYTTEDHEIPETVEKVYPKEQWEVKDTVFKVLPSGFKKPNAAILMKILIENNSKVNNAIYIGDKLDRDIYMASQINMVSVHASYGYITDNKEYELLRDVTHWSKKEVKREKQFKKGIKDKTIIPTYTITNFSQLLDIFAFTEFKTIYEKDFVISEEDKANKIEIWKSTVEVQKHFNDLQIRIRNYGITLFTFIFAGIGYCLKDNIFLHLFGISFSLASLIALIGVLVIVAIRFMDLHMYHRLLEASVAKGIEIEKSLSFVYPEISLSSHIKSKSPFKFMFGINVHSSTKLRFFYFLLLIPLILTFILTIFLNSSLMFKKEYDYVRDNSKRITSLNTTNLPNTSGLLIVTNNDGSLFTVKEVDNIPNGIINLAEIYKKRKIDILKNKRVYFSEPRIGRKELEEYINEKGIKLNQ